MLKKNILKLNRTRNLILLIFQFVCLFNTSNAQISQPGTPESFNPDFKSAVIIPSRELRPIDIVKFLQEDRANGIPNRYGVVEQTAIDIIAEGVQTAIPGKGTIWQYEFHSSQCHSIGIEFGNFHLPNGATVFIYNKTRSELLGAFTHDNNNAGNHLIISDIPGQDAIVEYFEPTGRSFPGELVIESITQSYRDPLKASSIRIGINCPQGANWQDAKHSVCMFTFHDSQYSYDCTGFLVNNVREDGTPYFETANHCISTPALARTVVAYFNFENSSCTSADAIRKQSLSGATLKATNSYSDFTLLQLNEYPPAIYLPYFAGWDASGSTPLLGTSIHHPQGTAKCIAIENKPPFNYSSTLTWTDPNTGSTASTTAPNTHWDVQFTSGEVEGGSSGAPLFDQNAHVIGQLHGGSTGEDYYGKFSVSWNHGGSSSTQLQNWLDPDSKGIKSLEGTYSKVKPKAAFSTALTRICPESIITLNDSSIYGPTSWTWNITPSTYQYSSGSGHNSKNPQVKFLQPGIYTISLIVANANGTDTLTRTNYIQAGDLQVKLSGLGSDGIVCGCNLIDYPFAASGALNYSFSMERTDKISTVNRADSIFLSLRPEVKKYGSFSSWLKVIGKQGSCASADSVNIQVSMPTNDDVENSIQLHPGRNVPYANFCASLESGEAVPSSSMQKTIWFTFLAPSSGKITIDTHGFNDQIAVYDASSYTPLLSGNSAGYKLVATNNGRSLTDGTALIENLSLAPSRKYFLQVGGTDGAIGDVIVDLLSNSLEVYPNPTAGVVNIIISNDQDGTADMSIISFSGQVMLNKEISVTKEHNSFLFDFSELLSGVYFVNVKMNGTTINKKLIIRKT